MQPLVARWCAVLFPPTRQSTENRQKAQQLLSSVERVQQDFESDTSEISRLATGLLEQKQLAAILRRRIDEFEDRLQLMYEMVGVGLSAQALAHDVPPILQHLDDQAKSLSKLGKARPLDAPKVVNSIEGIRASIEAVGQMLDFVQPMLRGRRLSRRKAKLVYSSPSNSSSETTAPSRWIRSATNTTAATASSSISPA